MQPTTLLKRCAILIAWVAVVNGPGGAVLATATADANPCAVIDFDPGPPPIRGQPTAAGRVTDAATGSGIAGATLEINRCVFGGPSEVAAVTTTDGNGNYAFESLLGSEYYFVEAVMLGPLAGLEPAAGTTNPTSAVWLENNVLDLDLRFE
jgi:hypothetical protein